MDNNTFHALNKVQYWMDKLPYQYMRLEVKLQDNSIIIYEQPNPKAKKIGFDYNSKEEKKNGN